MRIGSVPLTLDIKQGVLQKEDLVGLLGRHFEMICAIDKSERKPTTIETNKPILKEIPMPRHLSQASFPY